ncbi:hypothetical protein EWM64_g5137 [Hericium alpestre]|uniref:DNA ligase n=1 Tax=Hericium alpestre TaxID=135208 RepID=A0A4Y9ZXE7_9AGAM|nr:hypothetical protein EWM64_g5137 [Hericium alpestre]
MSSSRNLKPARPSSASPRKKQKLAHDQARIDSFFLKPSGPSSTNLTVASTSRVSPSHDAGAIKQLPEIIDLLSDDEAPVLNPPDPPTPQGISSGSAGTREEVIDVDLLDTQVTAAPPVPTNTSTSKHTASPVGLGAEANDPFQYPSLSVDPAAYLLDAFQWPPNSVIPYSFLAHTLSTLSSTRSRIVIINTLTNTFRTICHVHPASLLPSLYLLSNSLSPPYSPIELGLGPSMIFKAIMHVSGLTSSALKRLYKKTGDPGDVAFEAKSNVRTLIPHPRLLVPSVYDSLLRIARVKGQGSVNQKQAIVEKLLVAAKGEEIRFLVRTLSQHIRVGAVRTSMLTALARALVLTPPSSTTIPIPVDSPFHASSDLIAEVSSIPTNSAKSVNTPTQEELLARFARAESLIKKVFVQHPNYDHIVTAILEAGLDGLAERVPLTVGIPLHPTLGSPMRSLDEVYERLDEQPFVAEFKYDGQRAQIHAWTNDTGKTVVKVFSRHLEDMTEKYPDVVHLARHIMDVDTNITSFILDAEIVAIDPNDESLKTFQELSNRPRKDVLMRDVKVSVSVFAFDLMYFNGQILLGEPFRQRRSMLQKHFPPVLPPEAGSARLRHVESCGSEEGKENVEEFWLRAVDSRCEGLMIKLLDHGEVLEGASARKEKLRKKPLPATYEPDKRTSAWLKLKKDYVTGLGDSLDLVPVGAWHGNGRKAQWWSPVLLALRDPGTGTLVAMCKCMSDVFYKAMKERYAEDTENCSKRPLWGEVETGGYSPSVYFRPHEVWEIRGADITISPVSVAAKGMVSDDKGLSLRFPRFIRMREDKPIDDASTPEFLAGIWRNQQGKGKDRAGADEGQLVDVDLSEEGSEEEDSSDEEIG